ncbi:MAG TPA: glycerophosphodiester phosphodiesterase family protein [Acidimicrobiia bacterium]
MTLVLAHRGASRVAPENTLAAFRKAAELGADGVELDVHRTADGALVVRHDAASAAGVLPEMTESEVREALPGVPLLAEALDVCDGLLVNVEIKNSPREPAFDPDDTAAGLLVELLARRDHRDRVLVSSFRLASIDRVRQLDPTVPTALLVALVDPLDALDLAEQHGHCALHPQVDSLAADRAPAVAGAAHDRRMQVNVWTVNDPDEIGRLADAGIDAVITDAPDVARAALGR